MRELTDLTVTRIDTVDAGAQADARIAIWKRASAEPEDTKVAEATKTDDKHDDTTEGGESFDVSTIEDDATRTAVEQIVAERDGLATKVADAQAALTKVETEVAELKAARDADADNGDDDPVAKALASDPAAYEAYQAGLAAKEAEVAKAKREAEADREQLHALAKREREREFRDMAGTMPHVGPREQVAKSLDAIDAKLSPDEAEAIRNLLRVADERIAAGSLLNEVGKSFAPDEGSELARAIAKRRETHTDETYEQAQLAVLNENPALYEQSRSNS